MAQQSIAFFWFRRDLRLEDNRGLAQALRFCRAEGLRLVPIFIFDSVILDRLEDRADSRVNFIVQTLKTMSESLRQKGAGLICMHGEPSRVWAELLNEGHKIRAVFTNHDYEPYARERDAEVERLLKTHEIHFESFKDQVIFEKSEVVKDDGRPYTVFTPYAKKWRSVFKLSDVKAESCLVNGDLFASHDSKIFRGRCVPSLESLGFRSTDIEFPSLRVETDLLVKYAERRNVPAIRGTSRLGLHLRFGTVSIRKLVAKAFELRAESWLNELIWREFFMQILWHFPHVAENAFRPQYDRIQWRQDEKGFERWCKGMTGYPIVDAGMRELNETGFMHNRVRMIAASFLTKHLLVDWRWGEAYFAAKLLDFDLAANNGNWQWVAGSGCDAAPYFRVFSPDLQAKKFDPDGKYIRQWVPELGSKDYPEPMVEHAMARARALAAYKAVQETSV